MSDTRERSEELPESLGVELANSVSLCSFARARDFWHRHP